MPYKLKFSDQALAKLEDLERRDAKRLRQVFRKAVSLGRKPYAQGAIELKNLQYRGMKGLRADEGEDRIVYAVDKPGKVVQIALLLSRSHDYRELEGHED